MEMCAGFTSQEWRTELRPHLDADDPAMWDKAIGVFERRIQERFLRCIDALLELDDARNQERNQYPIVRPGFSIMALCCLLVETLQSFYEGGRNPGTTTLAEHCTYPAGRCVKDPSTASAFKRFLKQSPYFKEDFKNSKICGDFAIDVRNALLHEAETRHGWLITRSFPAERILLECEEGYKLNRTNFYRALSGEFNDYLLRLRDSSQDAQRKNFLKKMDSISDTQPSIE